MIQNKTKITDYKILKKRGEKHILNDEYDEALKCFKQALELCEKKVGKLHKESASLYNNIGVAYLDIGKYNTSKTWFNKSLETYKEIGEDTGLGIGYAYSNLGVLYSKLGKYNDSIKYYSLAKDIREKILGPKHKETLLVSFNLSTVYIHMQKYDESLELLQKSYKILRKKVFDSNKYQYATTCNSIGLNYRKKGDSETALKWYFKAVKIANKTIKTTKSLLITIYGNISAIYRDKGDYSTSVEYQKKALEYINAVHSDAHPKAGNIYAEMGSVNYRQKNYDQAIECALKVIDIREKTLGAKHNDTALAYSNAGIYYFSKSDFPNAVKYYKKSSDSYRSYYDEKSQKFLKIYGELAKSYFRNKQYEEAAAIYKDMISIRESLDGNQKESFKNITYNIARCYEELLNEDAIKWYKKCIDFNVDLYGKNDNRTTNIMSFLARTHFKFNQYDKCIVLYDKIIDIIKEKSEINYNFLLDIYLNKVTVYKKLEQMDKAIDANLEALAYFNENNSDEKIKAILTYTLAFSYSKNKEFSEAVNRFKTALKLMEKRQTEDLDTGNEYIYAQIYREMALIYFNIYNDYISSIEYYEKCISIHKTNYGNDVRLAQIYRDVSFPHFKLANYEKAEEYCLAALDILFDKFDETHVGVIEINGILDRIHSQQYNEADNTDNPPSFLQ